MSMRKLTCDVSDVDTGNYTLRFGAGNALSLSANALKLVSGNDVNNSAVR